eukprot:c7756_g1_i1.p1 GENE.c7756_g1_i1~~c7756_g1_i1.p1  ORF type:complete len:888 (+),score=276.05 c7756_g1_i1:78-2666(+)
MGEKLVQYVESKQIGELFDHFLNVIACNKPENIVRQIVDICDEIGDWPPQQFELNPEHHSHEEEYENDDNDEDFFDSDDPDCENPSTHTGSHNTLTSGDQDTDSHELHIPNQKTSPKNLMPSPIPRSAIQNPAPSSRTPPDLAISTHHTLHSAKIIHKSDWFNSTFMSEGDEDVNDWLQNTHQSITSHTKTRPAHDATSFAFETLLEAVEDSEDEDDDDDEEEEEEFPTTTALAIAPTNRRESDEEMSAARRVSWQTKTHRIVCKCWVFSRFPMALVDQIFRCLEFQTFKHGDTIANAGDDESSLVLVLEGTASMTTTAPNGSSNAVILYSGDCFGESSLLNPCKRTATVVALGNVKCATLTANLIETIPEFKNFLALSLNGIFEDASGEVLEKLMKRMEVQRYVKGDVVIQEGVSVDCDDGALFTIVEGEAEVIHSTRGHVTYLYPEHSFGEAALFENNPRETSVVVASDTLVCLVLSRKSFENCVPQTVAVEIQSKVETAAQLRRARDRAILETFCNVDQHIVLSPISNPQNAPQVGELKTLRLWRLDDGSRMINEYRVLREIGRGTYGLVYQCAKHVVGDEIVNVDERVEQRHYAVKVVKKSVLMKRRQFSKKVSQENVLVTDRELGEVVIMKKLNHPNIVRLFEVIDDPEEDELILVMEYVDGGDVMTYLRAGPMDEDLAFRLFRQMLCAVNYMHSINVLHCDIKPANIIVTKERGEAKLCDFGVSRAAISHDKSYLSRGTPAFMAPELLTSRNPTFTPAVDVWGLGACLFMFVTGHPPFSAFSSTQLAAKIRNSPVEFPPNVDVDVQLKDLIVRMLHKRPNKRISLRDVMTHPWVTKDGLFPLPRQWNHRECSSFAG